MRNVLPRTGQWDLHRNKLLGHCPRKTPAQSKAREGLSRVCPSSSGGDVLRASVLWSDEAKLELFGHCLCLEEALCTSRHLPFCQARRGVGFITLWACFEASDSGCLIKVSGVKKQEHYMKILDDNVKQSSKEFILGKRTFMQDNDPKYSWHSGSRTAKLMFWSEQDLNPIENLWPV